jgi:hypothetical protein
MGWEPQISRRRWTKRCLCWGVRQKTSYPSSPMAHPENSDLLTTIVQLLTEQGSDGFAEGIRLLVNEAMVRERSAALRAEPYQRSEGRLGHANGYKDRTLSTRVGRITFAVPQVRGRLEFYPSTLDKGIRSEQALTVALAEMYVQGVSTPKSPPLSNSSAAPPSVQPKSVPAPPNLTLNSRFGAPDLSGHPPMSSSTPATKRSASAAISSTAPSSSPWVSAPTASAQFSESSHPRVGVETMGFTARIHSSAAPGSPSSSLTRLLSYASSLPSSPKSPKIGRPGKFTSAWTPPTRPRPDAH